MPRSDASEDLKPSETLGDGRPDVGAFRSYLAVYLWPFSEIRSSAVQCSMAKSGRCVKGTGAQRANRRHAFEQKLGACGETPKGRSFK
jgi:hypothetical protein